VALIPHIIVKMLAIFLYLCRYYKSKRFGLIFGIHLFYETGNRTVRASKLKYIN